MALRTRTLMRLRSPLLMPAVEGHDEVVGVAAQVDGSANLGHSQRDTVVLEHGKVRPNWLP
ncbi:hypothetical protein A6A27_35255 [Micromonospora sp. CB01531]|nr:hypothetical protein A6A27_35255 [Micromonospora sp. CB01531]